MFDYDYEIIEILLDKFKINNIVIDGLSNNNLVDFVINYCDDNGVNINLIDSFESKDVISKDYIVGDVLNILQNFKDFDAIFINDDPNWYTLYNELNIIKKNNVEFPLVLICNNMFPHMRRDSYRDPKRIPSEFLNDYTDELDIDGIFIKDGLYHAIDENSPKNGVFTAIDDFLSENYDVAMLDLNISGGFTVLYSSNGVNKIRIGLIMDMLSNKQITFDDFYNVSIKNQILHDYIINNFDFIKSDENIIESLNIEINDKNKLLYDYGEKIKKYTNEINYKNSQIDNFDSKLSIKDSKIKHIESILIKKELMIDDQELEIKNQKLMIDDQELEIKNQKLMIDDQELEIKNQKLMIDDQYDKLNQAHSQISSLKNNLLKKEKNLHQMEYDFINQIEDVNIRLSEKDNEINEKNYYLDLIKNKYNSQNFQIDSKNYCINCFKEEISINKLEIQYLKKNSLIKKFLNPFSYIYLIYRSNFKELSINIKLYNALKDSDHFSIGYYLKNNPDLRNSNWCKYFSPELHYVCKGFNENRRFNKKYFNMSSKIELLKYLLK